MSAFKSSKIGFDVTAFFSFFLLENKGQVEMIFCGNQHYTTNAAELVLNLENSGISREVVMLQRVFMHRKIPLLRKSEVHVFQPESNLLCVKKEKKEK